MAATESKSKAAWKSKKVHEDITLPSGMKVDITIPNLSALIKADALPNNLLDVATKAATNSEVPDDLFEQMDDLNTFLVSKSLVKPALTAEEVNDVVPAEDIDMLVSLATRRIDIDAVGHQIAGLETIDSFRRFRGLDALDPDLLAD
jgi:hypothetical protein